MSIGQKDEEEEKKKKLVKAGPSWAYHHHAGPVISLSPNDDRSNFPFRRYMQYHLNNIIQRRRHIESHLNRL
jgi:hypothetical protein